MTVHSEDRPSPVERDWRHCGLRCVVVFTRQTHRCGYVFVPKTNPVFDLKYDDVPVDVHGGLTFGSRKLVGVRETDEGSWFGFDCAHLGDAMVNMSSHLAQGHHWTTEEVVKETERLAEQLSKVTWGAIVRKKLEYLPDWFVKRVKVIE